MTIKGILFVLMIAIGLFVGAFYLKVELTTSLKLDEFEDTQVPLEITDYSYRKVFNANDITAKLLYVLSNGDKYWVTFTREPEQSSDPLSLKEFGPWEYSSHEVIEGNTFPPYF